MYRKGYVYCENLIINYLEGYVDNDNAKIWYATYGSGHPVVLLHGGLGNSRNWGYQVAFLIDEGYMPIVIDSRGHGKSTRDEHPYSYQLMAQDLKAVLDVLKIDQAEGFNDLVEALTIMQKSQPNYTEADLNGINVPVLVVHSEHDEFIKEEHSRYIAEVIPGARFQLLQGVSHFAPLQRPDLFNETVLEFLEGIKY